MQRAAPELTDAELVRAELGIDCIIELVARNTLIRTTSGKPSRHSTRNDYLQNMLQLNPATS